MEQILFSIIVVCLNPGDKLKETISSIRKQTYPHYEIVVKDGMSTDDSIEKLPEDSRIKVIRKEDRGIYDAMNQAVAQAAGDYVYFLNCGDRFYDENVLGRINDSIRNRMPEQAGSGRMIIYGDIYDRITGERIASNPAMDAFGCYRNVPCHQACVYGAELVREKQFDTSYKVRADYEHFLWCFFRGKAKTFYVPELIADYEGGGYSETKENLRKSAKEHKEIVGKYMTVGQIFKYRMLMLATLASFRTWLSHNEKTAHFYQRIKSRWYRRRS